MSEHLAEGLGASYPSVTDETNGRNYELDIVIRMNFVKPVVVLGMLFIRRANKQVPTRPRGRSSGAQFSKPPSPLCGFGNGPSKRVATSCSKALLKS